MAATKTTAKKRSTPDKRATRRRTRPVPSVVPDGGLSALLRLPPGPVDLTTFDTRSTKGFPGKDKDEAAQVQLDMLPRLTELQERLYAQGKENPEAAARVLVLLQGMDTSGKGGVIRHAVGMVDPQGVQITSFKAPTKEELQHDFLWRIEKELPLPGMIGVFDRSHYEDVLVVRVDQLVEPAEWQSRYERINEFESGLVEQGITLIKCFLHVSYDKQKERLMERLERPDKHWKYNPGDLVVRGKWGQYREAYAEALERCNPEHAPWYVVPADRKWYRNWAVSQLLVEHLEALNPQWPKADYDVEEQKRLLAAT